MCFQLFGVEFVLDQDWVRLILCFCFKPKRSGEPSAAPKVLDAMEYWQRCEEIGSVLLKLFTCHHGHTNLEFVRSAPPLLPISKMSLPKFQKLSHWDFINRQLDLKRPISTIYSVPLFLTSNFKLDWLHVVDLGVTLDSGLFGQLFSLFIAKTWQ